MQSVDYFSGKHRPFRATIRSSKIIWTELSSKHAVSIISFYSLEQWPTTKPFAGSSTTSCAFSALTASLHGSRHQLEQNGRTSYKFKELRLVQEGGALRQRPKRRQLVKVFNT